MANRFRRIETSPNNLATIEQNTMVKQALITGGAGFIGSHLAERLIAEGHHVVALDNLSTGSYHNVQHLLNHSRFELIAGDISNEALIAPLIKRADVVFHLAAAVGVKLIMDKPLTSMTTNIRGTETVLELASKWNKRLLLASTSEVYGKNTKTPFSEDDDLVYGNTMKTRWSYACSKAIDEFLAIAHHRENALPVTIARFFNTVGARQSDQYGMVLPTFVNQALNDKPITVHGDGTQRRTFTHVLDTVDASYRLAMDESAVGEVFNIGGSIEVSMMDLAVKIKRKLNSRSQINCIPYSEAFESKGFEDMQRRVPDCNKLDLQIGYQPRYSLDDIIDSVIEHCRPLPQAVAMG